MSIETLMNTWEYEARRENDRADLVRARLLSLYHDLQAERDRLRQIGDNMQSEASRLAAWVRGENLEMHWEAYLALAAVERCVRDWRAARDATTEERSVDPCDDSIDMGQLAGEMLTALAPYWHQQDSMTAPAAITRALAERDRYREALLRVSRDRREPDKVFAQVSTAVGFDALVETGLVRPLVRDGDRSAYVEAPASNQKEVGG